MTAQAPQLHEAPKACTQGRHNYSCEASLKAGEHQPEANAPRSCPGAPSCLGETKRAFPIKCKSKCGATESSKRKCELDLLSVVRVAKLSSWQSRMSLRCGAFSASQLANDRISLSTWLSSTQDCTSPKNAQLCEGPSPGSCVMFLAKMSWLQPRNFLL